MVKILPGPVYQRVAPTYSRLPAAQNHQVARHGEVWALQLVRTHWASDEGYPGDQTERHYTPSNGHLLERILEMPYLE